MDTPTVLAIPTREIFLRGVIFRRIFQVDPFSALTKAPVRFALRIESRADDSATSTAPSAETAAPTVAVLAGLARFAP